LAATRWPWWMGSKVPPITPSRRRRAVKRTSGVLATAAEGDQGGEQGEEEQERAEADEVRHGPRGLVRGLGGERDQGVHHGGQPTGRGRAGRSGPDARERPTSAPAARSRRPPRPTPSR